MCRPRLKHHPHSSIATAQAPEPTFEPGGERPGGSRATRARWHPGWKAAVGYTARGRLRRSGLPRSRLLRPPAVIAIKDFAEFVEHFRSDPDTPTGKSFACSSGRAFFFPSSTHRGNFEQVRTFILRFRHGLECHRGLLKTRCLFAAKHPPFHYFPSRDT
jgi:hypothetical protein